MTNSTELTLLIAVSTRDAEFPSFGNQERKKRNKSNKLNISLKKMKKREKLIKINN